MNAAIMRKTSRDSWWLLLLVPVVLVLFEILVVRAFGELPAEAAAWLDRPFFKRFIRMLLGADLAGNFTATGAHDHRLSTPLHVRRHLGPAADRRDAGDSGRDRPRHGRPAAVLTYLACVRLRQCLSSLGRGRDRGLPRPTLRHLDRSDVVPTMGTDRPGATAYSGREPVRAVPLRRRASLMLVSSIVSRRGSAIAIVLSGLLLSFLLNFLATLWPAIERVAALGLLHYYKPLPCIGREVGPSATWSCSWRRR